MKTIDFENHFITQEWVDALLANDGHPRLTDDEATGKWRLYYQADAFEPFGVMPTAARPRRGPPRRDGRRRRRLRRPLAHRARLRAARRRGRAAGSRSEPTTSWPPPSTAHPDRFAGYAALYPKDVDGAVAGARALRQGARLQGLEDALQLRRLVPRREALLADPRQGRGARRAGVPAPRGADDPRAAHLRARAGRRGLRLRHRDGDGDGAPHPLRRLRRLPASCRSSSATTARRCRSSMQRIDHPFVRPYIKADGAAVPGPQAPAEPLPAQQRVGLDQRQLPAGGVQLHARGAGHGAGSSWAPTIPTRTWTSAWTSSPGCRSRPTSGRSSTRPTAPPSASTL